MEFSKALVFTLLSQHFLCVFSARNLRGSVDNVRELLIFDRVSSSLNSFIRKDINREDPDASSKGIITEGKTEDSYFKDACPNQQIIQVARNISLSPENAIPRESGADDASGTASVYLIQDGTCDLEYSFRVCVQIDIHGLEIWKLHLTRGKIFSSGPAVVDFSKYHKDIGSGRDSCSIVSEDLFHEIQEYPDEFHLTILDASAEHSVDTRTIRGQLVQEFSANLVDQSVMKQSNQQMNVKASGTATITIESGGQVLCLEARILGFGVTEAHLHVGKMGDLDGSMVADLTSTKIESGLFSGCRSIQDLGMDVQAVLRLLSNKGGHYLEFLSSNSGNSDLHCVVQGQLLRDVGSGESFL